MKNGRYFFILSSIFLLWKSKNEEINSSSWLLSVRYNFTGSYFTLRYNVVLLQNLQTNYGASNFLIRLEHSRSTITILKSKDAIFRTYPIIFYICCKRIHLNNSINIVMTFTIRLIKPNNNKSVYKQCIWSSNTSITESRELSNLLHQCSHSKFNWYDIVTNSI